jgi:hypothetical protein
MREKKRGGPEAAPWSLTLLHQLSLVLRTELLPGGVGVAAVLDHDLLGLHRVVPLLKAFGDRQFVVIELQLGPTASLLSVTLTEIRLPTRITGISEESLALTTISEVERVPPANANGRRSYPAQHRTLNLLTVSL